LGPSRPPALAKGAQDPKIPLVAKADREA